jgi:hypothetical protein
LMGLRMLKATRPAIPAYGRIGHIPVRRIDEMLVGFPAIGLWREDRDTGDWRCHDHLKAPFIVAALAAHADNDGSVVQGRFRHIGVP